MLQTMKIAFHNRRKSGFTLIEILVVMAIIGILAGLLFPGVSAAVNQAKKARTANTCANLKNSISAYFTEYRRYPLLDGYDTPYHDVASNEDLMDILLAADTSIGEAKNPRGITFFSGRTARRSGPNTYINGINMNSSGGGSLWDDYGRLYGVRIDTESRNRMPNPAVETPSLSGDGAPSWGSEQSTGSLPPIITESVGVWSAGKDEERAKDNIMTW